MKQEKFGMVLPITLIAYFLILMDNSIIFTSSTQIGESLQMSANNLSWVSNAYTLTFGGFLLLSGRLSDLLGRKRVFLVGLIIFGVSSLFIGVSQNGAMMIFMRAIQGIGSSIIAPATLALMLDSYSGHMRQRAISYYGATAGIGASIGLLIGGGLTSLISWRAGFLINVPFTIALILLTIKFVEISPTKKIKIDYLGSLLSILGLVGFIFGLTERNISLVGISIVLLLAFIVRERTAKSPILPLILFKNRIRSGAYLARLLFMMAMLPYWFFVPQIMQSEFHFSALQAGLGFFPLTIVNFIIAMQLTRLTTKFGNSCVLIVGEIILFIGLLWTAFSDLTNGYWIAIALPMAVIGLGQGLILAPVTSAGVHDAPDELAGVASGLTNTVHQIGGPIGLTLIVATTSNFHTEVSLRALFTLIAGIIVAIMILGGTRNEH
ncbi:MFS transporter [Listeria seeligeri]|uniref:MFS transporter n=1 Tax=Listeria seeligeri TaxID=1640 RepID=UPI0016254329|nr:MFS transporter [Listeria seeligeri]MBC1422654.1 MFS transporter [Listeria seeligeri]MBC1752309.1 MFS transporter [Listeria seeligeri]MBC1830618.1 MFS transporter [Listeria seeligeri]MBC1845017.1 MFS transporter [Listeria seeligeri]MBC2232313.1 MFS transporter [Listeria seeligeri]